MKHFLLSWLNRALVTIGASIVLGVAVAPDAVGGTLRYWNSSSEPLTVNNEGGTPAGQAYGNWNIATGGTGTESKAYGYLKDLLPSNGYNVYFKLETWNQNYWSPKYLAATGLNPSGSYARAHMFVQESNRFGDPSAGPTITRGNAY